MTKQEIDASILTWGLVLSVLLFSIIVGCASTNDGLGDAALVGGGAAAGAAVGGTLWAAVIAAGVSLWNAISGGSVDPVNVTVGGHVSNFVTLVIRWALILLLAYWLLFARSRAALLDLLFGWAKAIVAKVRGDGDAAKEAAKDFALAVPRLTGAVGEPIERRQARERRRRAVR